MTIQQWHLRTTKPQPGTMADSAEILFRRKNVVGENQFMIRKNIQLDRERNKFIIPPSEILTPIVMVVGFVYLLNM